MQKFEKMIETLFQQYKRDIQKGYDLPLQLILFFDDKWLLFPDGKLKMDKDDTFFLFHGMIDRFKPKAYAVVSDTNVRDPVTLDIIGEQILAAIYSPDGTHRVFSQPYLREDGKVTFTDKLAFVEGLTLGGRLSSFYEPWADPKDPIIRSLLSSIMEHEAMPYEQKAPKPRHDDGPGLH